MFWDSTPREFYAELAAARARSQHESDRDMTLAWRIAALMRTPRDRHLPDLRELITATATGPDGRQAPQTQRAILERLSEQYGIPLRTVTKH